MDEHSTNQLSPAASSSTSTVPFGPFMNDAMKKIETPTKMQSDASTAVSPSPNSKADQYHDCRIYVSNIPFSFRSPDLVEMFSPYGIVSNAEIVMNERGSKGFGFVTLDSKESSEAARAALHGTMVQGRVIEVKKATTIPHRRGSTSSRPQNSSPLQQNIIIPPPRVDLLSAGQLPSIQPQPLFAQSATDPLSALLFAQNSLRFQPMVSPLTTRDLQFSTLLLSRQLPLQQHATVMAGGIPLSSLAISPVPLQLLSVPPPQGIENVPAPMAATMMPLNTPGFTYTSIPAVNPLIQPALPSRLPQDVSNQAFSNVMCDSGLLKTSVPAMPYSGYLDLGSLGLPSGILPPYQSGTNLTKENAQTNGLRALDQSCVIDTSFHGEPLKEGQFGPIGKAVPPGNVNHLISASDDIRCQSSVSFDENAVGRTCGQNDGVVVNSVPIYHQFEPTIDRNGRKRLSSLDGYHLNKKQAKSA